MANGRRLRAYGLRLMAFPGPNESCLRIAPSFTATHSTPVHEASSRRPRLREVRLRVGMAVCHEDKESRGAQQYERQGHEKQTQ